jgi:hypothetical protein
VKRVLDYGPGDRFVATIDVSAKAALSQPYLAIGLKFESDVIAELPK